MPVTYLEPDDLPAAATLAGALQLDPIPPFPAADRTGFPFFNGTLTAITASGTGGEYDDADVAGTERAFGSQGIIVSNEVVETLSPGRIDEVEQTRLEIPYAVGVLVQRGDTLTYTYGGTTHVRVAGTILHAREVNRVRVLVENA